MTIFECDERDEEGRESGITIFECDEEGGMIVSLSFVALGVIDCGWEKIAMTETKACDKEARESAISISLDFVPPYGVSICLDSFAPKREVRARV